MSFWLSGALEAQKWKQTAFAQTLLQQELLTTGLAELEGLAWERGVGLISIATRKHPRRALALPPDGGARKGATERPSHSDLPGHSSRPHHLRLTWHLPLQRRSPPNQQQMAEKGRSPSVFFLSLA